jgi:surfeit locus 1 family protein
MIVGRFRIRKPGLVPTLATLVLLPILVSLGFWQLHRADYKYALRAEREHNAALPPVTLDAAQRETPHQFSRKVRVSGRFDLDHQLLLDNRTHNSVPGYYVYTPLLVAGAHAVVLVNRGWVPQGVDRRHLPPLPGPADKVSLVGVMARPPEVALRLGTLGEGYPDWPKVVQYVDTHWAAKQLDQRVLGFTLLQDSGADYGMIRDWKEFQSGLALMPPEKHVSYAVQWFAMAVVLVLIYIGVHVRRVRSDAERLDVERGKR